MQTPPTSDIITGNVTDHLRYCYDSSGSIPLVVMTAGILILKLLQVLVLMYSSTDCLVSLPSYKNVSC